LGASLSPVRDGVVNANLMGPIQYLNPKTNNLQFFNPASFSNVVTSGYDTAPRNALRGPGRTNWIYHWQRPRHSIANESHSSSASMRSTSSTTPNSITLTTMPRTLAPRLAKSLGHMIRASCNWGLTCGSSGTEPIRNLESRLSRFRSRRLLKNCVERAISVPVA
jgi:hypothetical protein